MESADTKRIRIKISGLARLCEVDWVNRIRPDYVTFVFFDSHCRVGIDQAEYLKRKLLPGIQAVGSFSCLSCWLVAELLGSGVIDAAHIHGDCTVEEMEQLRRLTDKPLIKTIYIDSAESIRRAQEYPVDYLMYDCRDESSEGQKRYLKLLDEYGPQKREFFLSDRLCSVGVEEAIAAVKPYGININSPIEKRMRGDPEQIARLVQKVRELEAV